MGVTHLREGRVDMALEDFQKAAKLDPKNAYVMKGLGQAYAAKRKWSDAIAAFRKALELNPYYVDVRNDLGTALILSGDREEGKKEFITGLQRPHEPHPGDLGPQPRPGVLRGEELHRGHQLVPHEPEPEQGLPDAYLGLADVLSASAASTRRSPQLEAAVKELPEDPSLQLALGQAYFKAGRFTEARARLEEAVRKDPTGAAGRRAAEVLKELPRLGHGPRRPGPQVLDSALPAPARAPAPCRSPASQAALLLDAQGEVVVEAGARDERHRLIGAYQGIGLAMAQRTTARHAAGRIDHPWSAATPGGA